MMPGRDLTIKREQGVRRDFLYSAFKLYQRRFLLMETRVKDLTVGELDSLISDTVRGAMEDLMEDILALSSDEYLRSIEEARGDH